MSLININLNENKIAEIIPIVLLKDTNNISIYIIRFKKLKSNIFTF